MDLRVRLPLRCCRRGAYRHRLGCRLFTGQIATEACAGLATPSTVCGWGCSARLRQVRQLPELPLAECRYFCRFKALLNSATKYRCLAIQWNSRAILLVEAGLNAFTLTNWLAAFSRPGCSDNVSASRRSRFHHVGIVTVIKPDALQIQPPCRIFSSALITSVFACS